MKFIEANRQDAAEQGLTEAEALKNGSEAGSLEFVDKDPEACAAA